MINSIPSGKYTIDQKPLYEAAQKLEVSFLAQMLKSAGFGEQRTEFGGGSGEEQFASFYREAQAEALVANGGIGLTEHLFQSLLKRSDHGQ